MELRVLNYFLMVAREENITRAAQLLHVTQPTLSRQLMQLEAELGVKLFRRGQHNITLTEDGMLLKRRAQDLVALADKTKREFSRAEALSGEISIGCGETRNMHDLSRMISGFNELYPLVQFEIFTAIADDIKDRMDHGSLDMGLLLEPVDISKYDFIRMPRKEEWGVLVREDSILAGKEFVTPNDLTSIPLLMVKRDNVRNELANWFGDCYEDLEIAATYNLIYNAAIMVMDRLGAALCLRFESDFQGLRFVPLLPKLETGCVLVWKKHQAFSPTTEHFIEHVKKYISHISGYAGEVLNISE